VGAAVTINWTGASWLKPAPSFVAPTWQTDMCCAPVLHCVQPPSNLSDREGSPFHELGLREIMDGVRASSAAAVAIAAASYLVHTVSVAHGQLTRPDSSGCVCSHWGDLGLALPCSLSRTAVVCHEACKGYKELLHCSNNQPDIL
jgi:hypothetical protein